jgi:hypothetical protein
LNPRPISGDTCNIKDLQQDSQTGGTISGTPTDDSATKQQKVAELPDLGKLWGTLPANVQADILALLSGSAKG